MLVNVQYSHCEVLYNQFFFFWTHNKRGMVIKCIKGELLLLVNEQQQWSEKRSLQLHLSKWDNFLRFYHHKNFISSHFAKEIDFSLRKCIPLTESQKRGSNRQCGRKSRQFLHRASSFFLKKSNCHSQSGTFKWPLDL